MRIARACWLPLLLLTAVEVLPNNRAVGGEIYHDPSGFSLAVPDGWKAVADPGNVMDMSALPAEARDFLKKSGAGMKSVKVLVLKVGAADFVSNVNVVIQPGEAPLTQASVDQLLSTLPSQYKSMGIPVEQITGRVDRAGNRDALLVEFVARFPGAPAPVRERQLLIPGGGQTFIVTCSAKSDQFTSDEGSFNSLLASFTAPPATTVSHPVWNGALRGALSGGIIGALAGLCIWGFKKAKRK